MHEAVRVEDDEIGEFRRKLLQSLVIFLDKREERTVAEKIPVRCLIGKNKTVPDHGTFGGLCVVPDVPQRSE